MCIRDSLKWNYTAQYSGYVYVYADIDGKDDVSFMINDDSTNTQTLGIDVYKRQ